MQTSQDIDAYWQANYPECVPIPYLLRSAYPERWVRFHSLPESKRYSEDEFEYQTILERHNAVLDQLAAPGEELVFVSTGYSQTPEPLRDYPDLGELDPKAQCWRTIAKHELDHDDGFRNYWHLFMSVWSWRPGIFDGVLRLVADAIVANAMIVSIQNRWIYHLYDGGADVILPTSEKRLELKHAFQPWLSPFRHGL